MKKAKSLKEFVSALRPVDIGRLRGYVRSSITGKPVKPKDKLAESIVFEFCGLSNNGKVKAKKKLAVVRRSGKEQKVTYHVAITATGIVHVAKDKHELNDWMYTHEETGLTYSVKSINKKYVLRDAFVIAAGFYGDYNDKGFAKKKVWEKSANQPGCYAEVWIRKDGTIYHNTQTLGSSDMKLPIRILKLGPVSYTNFSESNIMYGTWMRHICLAKSYADAVDKTMKKHRLIIKYGTWGTASFPKNDIQSK